MPFYHSGKGIWVEVHRALFAPSQLAELPVFNRENITAESKLWSLNKIPVMRLSTELQIVYTALHWALDFKRAGGLLPLIDIIYLLGRAEHAIRWDVICDWVQNSVAATHLYLVLSYLYQKKIVDLDKQVLPELFKGQRSFGSVNLKIAHHLITRYLVEGKMPLAQGKLSILWKNLLHDQPPVSNLASFCREMLNPGPAKSHAN